MVKTKKEITGTLKLQVPAGQATPAPPVGTALGPHGLNIQGFCQQFNAETQGMEKGTVVPVTISIYKDKSFSLSIGRPPTSHLIRKAIGLNKGSSAPGRDSAGKITKDQIRSVAEIKMEEMGVLDVESAMRSVEGTAISMGIKVE